MQSFARRFHADIFEPDLISLIGLDGCQAGAHDPGPQNTDFANRASFDVCGRPTIGFSGRINEKQVY
jgi:hypothetical protein